MNNRRFGADYWSVGREIDTSAINNGGYYDREQAENPQTHDRFGDPEDKPARQDNWKLEFPYGY